MNDNNRLVVGYLCAIGATIFWSGNFVVARGLTDSLPPVSLAFWRWVVAIVVFVPFAIKPLISEWHVIMAHKGYLAITAVLGISLFNTLIYIASHTTTAMNLSLISITFPIFIIGIARLFFNEPITLNKSAGILLVVIGVTSLVTRGDISKLSDLSFAVGDLWMLIAAFTFAVYSVLIKHKPSQLSIRTFQLSTFVIGLLVLSPFYLWESATTATVSFDLRMIMAILYVGVFASLVAFVLWSKAVAVLGPSRSSMVYYSLPVFSGLAAWLFLAEQIVLIHLVSMLFILAGVLIALVGRRTTG